jgi:hypothetical protein
LLTIARRYVPLVGPACVAFLFSLNTIFAQASQAGPARAHVAAETERLQKISPTILAAKTVFFEDRSGVPIVAVATLDELKKWGRFQIVADKAQADLILVLSASPPKGGHIIYSGGQTGTIEKSGAIDEDAVPNYHQSAPVRDAYLTVFDAKSGESLWTDSHIWGGLLTGRNSAGARLVTKLRKDMKK